MALVEYGGGGRRDFIFMLEEMKGMGWKKMTVALREVCDNLEYGGKSGYYRGRLGFGRKEEPS